MTIGEAIKSMYTWFIKRVSVASMSQAFLLLLVAFLTLYPLYMVIFGSFNDGSPVNPGNFTLDGYNNILTSLKYLNALWTTIWLAVVRTILTMAIAVFLVWVVTRTNTPFKALLRLSVVSQFFMPQVSVIIAWMMLLSPRSGIINVLIMNMFNLQNPVFNVFSYAGIIWVSITSFVPIVFLIILPSFISMDASLEESSTMSGASHLTTLRRVTIPMVGPALAGASILCLINYLENFNVEAFLGIPAGIYVVSTQIYHSIFLSQPAQYNSAMAFSVILLLGVALLVVFQWKAFFVKQHKFATVTGRGYAVRPINLRRWKYVTLTLVLLYFFASTLLPGIVMFLGPFMKYSGIFIGDWFTLENFRLILGDPYTWDYFWNTLILGIGTATGGVFLYTIVSYVVVRTRYAARGFMEFMSWVPYFMPGIVIALALLWVYVGSIRLPFPMYGTIQLLALCLIIKRMPLGVRTMNSVVIQIGKELEEAARTHGSSWWRTFKNIMLPLLRPGMISAWLLLAVFAVKDLVVALMLYGPNSKTLSVQMWALSQGGQASTDSQALVIGLLEVLLVLIFWLVAFLASRRSTIEGLGAF